MKKTVLFSTLLPAIFLATLAFGQSNELAVTAGGAFESNSVFPTGSSFVVGGNYARRFLSLGVASLYFELPIEGVPKSVFHVPTANNYSSLFVTPGVKLKLLPAFPVSPYLATGMGFARFHQDATSTVPADSSYKAVWDVAGGVDWKIFPFVSMRGEIRDFITATPSLTGINDIGHQHTLAAQAGLVLRF